MANQEIRDFIKKKGIYLWQIADEMRIHETTLVKKLRKELDAGQKMEVMSAVEQILINREIKMQTVKRTPAPTSYQDAVNKMLTGIAEVQAGDGGFPCSSDKPEQAC